MAENDIVANLFEQCEMQKMVDEISEGINDIKELVIAYTDKDECVHVSYGACPAYGVFLAECIKKVVMKDWDNDDSS
jgi:hypothetical protein